MGVLRVILACVVMLGHFGNHGFYMIGGDLAVQIFYAVSGFSMSIIFNETQKYKTVGSFYISRIIKLYPTYLVVATASLLIYSIHYFIMKRENVLFAAFEKIPLEFMCMAILLNFSLVLQDLTTFIFFQDGKPGLIWVQSGHSGLALIDTMVLPQSWTIALEIYFYALCPFALKNNRYVIFLLTCSLGILGALALLGLAAIDPWSYRFFPSQLYLFLGGVLSHKLVYPLYVKSIREKKEISLLFFLIILVLIIFNDFILPEGAKTFNHILVNISFIYLPAFYHVSKNFKIDLSIGRLSYPLYLTHFITYFIVGRVLSRAGIVDELNVAVATVVCCFGLSLMLDRYVINIFDKARYRLAGVD